MKEMRFLPSTLIGLWLIPARGVSLLARGLSLAGVVVLSALIWGYRILLKPLFPTSCRFDPSCSAYALEALRLHGPVIGSWLTLRRLLRCNPWGPHGHDPVPTPASSCSLHSSTRRS